jgi:hypothetical protein
MALKQNTNKQTFGIQYNGPERDAVPLSTTKPRLCRFETDLFCPCLVRDEISHDLALTLFRLSTNEIFLSEDKLRETCFLEDL